MKQRLSVYALAGVMFLSMAWADSILNGPKKVEFLLNLLESDQDYKVRIAAAEELGKVADGTLADWMVRAFRKEKNSAVRLAMLYAIGQIPDHRIIPPLLELAHEEFLREKEILAVERILWNFRSAIHRKSWEKSLFESSHRKERAMAAWILGVVGNKQTASNLHAGLKDPSAFVRTRAIQGLGRIGSPQSLPYCENTKKSDPDATVRLAARTCLSLIQLQQKRKLPKEKTHRLNLNVDLYGLKKSSITPKLFRKYQQKNVNPREVDEAVASLRPAETESRYDRSIPLIESELLHQIIQVDAFMITNYAFAVFEIQKLKRFIRDQLNEINQCYLGQLKKNKNLKGSVITDFQVKKSGKVTEVQAEEGTLSNGNVRECIANHLKELRFPKLPIDSVEMNYTFVFQPPKN